MPDDDDLTALLQDPEVCRAVLTDYHRHPRNCGDCEAFTCEAKAENPSCGDLLRLTFTIDSEDVITCAGFTGAGCAASQASASLLCERLQTLTKPQAREVIAAGLRMLEGNPFDAAVLAKCAVLHLFSAHPARRRCAAMAWEAASSALGLYSLRLNGGR